MLLSWAGVIGKMIGFMSSKLAAKWIELKLDEKKRAARSFAKLYFAMEELEEITLLLIEDLTKLTNGEAAGLGSSWLYVSKQLDVNSWQFLESVRELRSVVELFDPVLAAELVQLSDYKASFLMAASFTFEDEQSRTSLPVTYYKPAEKFLAIDYEKAYQWLQTREDLYDVGDVWEWPEDFLVRFHIAEEDLEKRMLSANDIESVLAFRKMLKRHIGALTYGKEQLRNLIITHFKIEDVLYVTNRLGSCGNKDPQESEGI